MAFADYRQDLRDETLDVNFLLDKHFHSGQPAVFQGADPGAQAKLKKDVASKVFSSFGVRVHPLQLVICGSAHLGFCPVPVSERFGRPFDPTRSDIDIAVSSPELFEAWWTELQTAGLDQDTRELISRDLFWGFINPANVQDVPNYGTKWWLLFGGLQTDRAHGIRGRLYKNMWSMQSYHRLAVLGGRRMLREEDKKVGDNQD